MDGVIGGVSEIDALVLPRAGGGPASLRRASVPEPIPGRGQVRVRVEACGLNPVDAGLSRGTNPVWRWPHVLGLDVAGIVEGVGDGVPAELLGRRVSFHGDLREEGGFARATIADARAVAVVPDSVDAVSAAALPCAGMTAYQAIIRRLHVTPGQTVVVTAGNGGVGGFAIQLARLAGARVIATASSQFERLHALGADEAVDYRAADARERIRTAAGVDGVDAVVDTVGPQSASDLIALLNHGAGIACVAGRTDFTGIPPFTVSPSIHEISLGAAYSAGADKHVRDLGTMLTELLSLTATGQLDPMVTRVIGIDDVPAALDEIAARHVTGKIVATWS